MIFGSMTDIILPRFGIPLMPPFAIIIILSVIGSMWYSIIKYGLMSITAEGVVLDVFKIMKEGLLVFNYEGRIISVNLGALQLLGYEEAELKGQKRNSNF